MPFGNAGRAQLALLAMSIAVAGCAAVIETVPFKPGPQALGGVCRSSLGSYYLPKALLSVSADIKGDGTAPAITLNDAPQIIADREQPFCLDYLSLPTAADAVTVDRNGQGLLQSIHSHVEDRTPAIVQTLIQTGENLAVAARQGIVTPSDHLDLSFDPFNWDDLMMAKAALRRFGFCLYVEGYSFPSEGLTAAQVQGIANKWCSMEPRAVPPYEPASQALASLPVPSEAMRLGVLYRPLIAHKVVILFKKDPGGRGAWELYQTKRFDLPNVAPVLAIGIQRAAFTTRATTVKFDRGTLVDVAIDKNSEAAGFVTIPLAAAKAIVDVPAQILKFRVADVQNHIALIDAQGQLLQALAKAAPPPAASSGAPGAAPKSVAVRNGQLAGSCEDAGGDPTFCKDFAKGSR